MDVWIDAWLDGLMDAWMNEWCVDGQIHVYMDRVMHTRIDGCLYRRWVDAWIGSLMRWID